MTNRKNLAQGITVAGHVNRYRVRIYDGDRQVNGGYYDTYNEALQALHDLKQSRAQHKRVLDRFLYG